MTPIASGNAALLGALAQPTTSYGLRSAARQEQIQMQSLVNQQQEVSLLKDQQAAAAIDEYQRLLSSQGFVGKDTKKMNSFLKNEFDVGLKNRIRDVYKGNLQRFYAAEGPQFIQGVANKMVASPDYQQAVQNRESVDQARKAIADGQVVTGAMDANTKSYITGERAMAEFLAGKRDKFEFYGSYKPQDDLKGIRERYPKGRMPWEIVNATPEEIQNELVANHGQQTALDKYMRQYQGVSVPYKYDPLNKQVEFQQAEAKMNMAAEAHGLRMKLGIETSLLNQQKYARNAAKAAAEGRDGVDYESATFDGAPDHTIQLPGIGTNMGPGYQGKDTLHGHTMYGKGVEALRSKIGISKPNPNSLDVASDMGEVYTLRGDKINLSGRSVTVIGVNPVVYSYGGDRVRDQKGNTGWGPNGLRGFAKVTVRIPQREAEKLDLYDPNWWLLPDWETRKGAGLYNPDNQTMTLIKPIGRIDRASGNGFIYELQKSQMGQKAANEYQSVPEYYDMGLPSLDD